MITIYDKPVFTGLWAFSMGLATILLVLLWLLLNKRVCLIISLAIAFLATSTAWITLTGILTTWISVGKGILLLAGASTTMLVAHIALLFFELQNARGKQDFVSLERPPQADYSSR